jgi:hypothetical protein
MELICATAVWFFCKYGEHCGFGMVGYVLLLSCFPPLQLWRHVPVIYFCSAINAPITGNTFEAFLAAAKAIGSSETTVSRSFSLFSQAACAHRLDRFAGFRQWPRDRWCRRSGDDYPYLNRRKFIIIDYCYDQCDQVELCESHRYQWLLCSLGHSI